MDRVRQWFRELIDEPHDVSLDTLQRFEWRESASQREAQRGSEPLVEQPVLLRPPPLVG